ncbi:class I adenylate-forming enzyme family protein [Paraburkholderia xenovorans]|uniref:class I adenylate-forming enzyme family protein n=1 Tax=Paraburkholderia xenovorans TaxID=36873 RepID=UPI001559BDD6|nr:class I adenylate-forming enzyme family protein [Paraburkholderia xenovorans]NPT36463.1 AMP-binding protein [Paraburkholderia xenovorans]
MSQPLKNLGSIGDEFRNEDRPVIIDLWDNENPREVDYPTFHATCDAIARGFVARGYGKGTRIGIFCSNRLEFLEVFYGAMRAGVIPVPMGILLPKDTIEWIIRDAELKLVFCDSELRAKLPSNTPHIVVESEEYEAFKVPGPFEAIVPTGDDVAFQPYTSGSTGRPKGVVLSHRAHVWVAETISKDRGFCRTDRMIVAAPLYHKHAMNAIKSVFVGGSTVVLMKKFEPRAYLDAVSRYRVSVLSGVPTIFAMILQQRDLIEGKDFSFVRLATMGGAPASDELIDAVAKILPNADIISIFGITETSAALFGSHPGNLTRPRHSVGWPIAGNEFKLIGGPDENFGVLHVRGPGMMNGYHNNPVEMERRLKDGWFNTGDVLRKDADGWYYFIGRSDDMFVCSGNNIYPGEVELMLERHPDIEQAVIVPVPDEIRHQIPYAYVVRRKGSALSEKDVKEHALTNAPPYQYPRKVIFVDQLLLNGVGKIDRKALQAQAHEICRTERAVAADVADRPEGK